VRHVLVLEAVFHLGRHHLADLWARLGFRRGAISGRTRNSVRVWGRPGASRASPCVTPQCVDDRRAASGQPRRRRAMLPPIVLATGAASPARSRGDGAARMRGRRPWRKTTARISRIGPRASRRRGGASLRGGGAGLGGGDGRARGAAGRRGAAGGRGVARPADAGAVAGAGEGQPLAPAGVQ
jgi:hypothetical protein